MTVEILLLNYLRSNVKINVILMFNVVNNNCDEK